MIKKNLLNIALSLLSSFLIFYLSLSNSWSFFWGSLSIPAQDPFSDLKAHIHFYNCFIEGINIYTQPCELIPLGNANISTHPEIWLKIVHFLNLNNSVVYNFFILTILTIYFFSLIKIYSNSISPKNKIFFFIFFFSTTNFILLERFATDIFVFILIFIILNFNNKIIKGFLIFIGILLKYYPIFLTSIFLKNKKYLFFLASFFVLFVFFIYLDQIKLVNNNILEVALIVAYGVRSITKAIYHLSIEYNFLINDSNYSFFKNVTIIIFIIYSLLLIFLGFLRPQKFEISLNDQLSNYFIAGSSIYIGTFIFGSNFDYRLIFLIFTIPYLMSLKNELIKNILIICYFISLNSFLIQHSEYFFSSDVLHWIYFLKAFIVYLCKFLVFTLLCFLIGSHLKIINFFKHNDQKK